MHVSFWGMQGSSYANCTVVGYVGAHSFTEGHTSRHTYVIEHDGNHYLARHTAVLGALVDAGLKRQLKRAGAPKLLRA
jgi:hypothetical protein